MDRYSCVVCTHKQTPAGEFAQLRNCSIITLSNFVHEVRQFHALQTTPFDAPSEPLVATQTNTVPLATSIPTPSPSNNPQLSGKLAAAEEKISLLEREKQRIQHVSSKCTQMSHKGGIETRPLLYNPSHTLALLFVKCISTYMCIYTYNNKGRVYYVHY